MSTTPVNFVPAIVFNNNEYNVGQLMYRAARMANALKIAGQGISPSEQQEFLDALNGMIDGWKAEGLMIPYTKRTAYTVFNNVESYSIGPGGMFDQERPDKIHRASFIVKSDPNPAEIPMRIILTFEEWQQYIVKSVGSNYPLALYYQNSTPLGTIRIWPVPNENDQRMAIYTPVWLSEFLTVDDVVNTPHAYREMIMYNLAVRIHEMYPNRPMLPSVESRADFYKQRVQKMQFTGMFINSDDAVLANARRDDWYGGYPKAWTPYY